MVLRIIVCILISLTLLFGAILASVFSLSGAAIYLHVIAFSMVAVLPLVPVVTVFRLGGLGRALKLALSRENASESNFATALLCIAAWRKSLFWAAVITMLIGIVAMLGDIKDQSAVGAGVAVTLLTLLYAFVLDFILLLPCKFQLEQKKIRG